MTTMGFLAPGPEAGKVDRFGHGQEYRLKEKWLLARGRLQVTNSPVYS